MVPSQKRRAARAAAMLCLDATQRASLRSATCRTASRERELRCFREPLAPWQSTSNRGQARPHSHFSSCGASRPGFAEVPTDRAWLAGRLFRIRKRPQELWRIHRSRLVPAATSICRQLSWHEYSNLSFRVDGRESKCHHSENSFVRYFVLQLRAKRSACGFPYWRQAARATLPCSRRRAPDPLLTVGPANAELLRDREE